MPATLGGTEAIFAATPSPPLAPGLSSAYTTLALGSALALLRIRTS